MLRRREFLKSAAAIGAGALVSGDLPPQASSSADDALRFVSGSMELQLSPLRRTS